MERIPFVIKEGAHYEAATTYLPYGTRTVGIAVSNQTNRPLKMWLRPQRMPVSYPETLMHGLSDQDDDLWIHWAGGEEIGAAVYTDEKNPLRDKSLRVWEVVPLPVPLTGSYPTFLNITHHQGPVQDRILTVQVLAEEDGQLQPLDCTLMIRLKVPLVAEQPVEKPVRGVWDSAGTRLSFTGQWLPDYVSRWWPSGGVSFRTAGDLPDRLSLTMETDKLWLKIDAAADGSGGQLLAEITDNDYMPGLDIHRLRPIMTELFHFCDDRYFVARIWFIWLEKNIGVKHEVPDAERIDVLFDLKLDPDPVPAIGTDFHYRETWGRLKRKERYGKVILGLGVSGLSTFARQNLYHFFRRSRVEDPARAVSDQLCKVVRWQKGPLAHVPLLYNVDLFGHITSYNVREARPS